MPYHDMNKSHQCATESTHQPDHEQEQVALIDTTAHEEEESNLFNILEEDLSNIGDEDPTEEEELEDLTREDD